ncbi:MAG: sigma-70 family RNA polymerase sigma factor [Polyangia bacterium]
MKSGVPHLKLVGAEPAPVGLAAVYRAYASYVAAVVFRLLGRDDEIDDVVQDVFLAAARGLERLREPEATKGWLATVAVRLSMRRLRRRRLWSFLGLDSVNENDILATSNDPADRLLLARVYAVLDEIPVSERVAWVLHRVEGETLPIVAQRCGCSLATVKRWIAKAQAKVEVRLS